MGVTRAAPLLLYLYPQRPDNAIQLEITWADG